MTTTTALQEIIPGITTEDLTVSLKEPGTHLLDSIIIRQALETHFGFEIPDKDWMTLNTIGDSLAYCNRLRTRRKVSTDRTYTIGMPQMANSALSESWLLKEMGDMHWEMLSKGLEQQSSAFTDAQGNRLYAAFVRINYAMSPLNQFRENATLQLSGAMRRFGQYAYYSGINGSSKDSFLEANMMTSFLARTANDNSQIARSLPVEYRNNIEELTETPAFYTEHRQLNKRKIDEFTSYGYSFQVTDSKVESTVHTVNPHYDINGAGLLYFANYPLIADTCTSHFFRHTLGIKDYDRNYHTCFRDVFYFANCNADDRIIVVLNSIGHIDDGKLQTSTSLYRESDNKLMARVFTVKEKR